MNALSHGLTARKVVIPGENEDEYAAFRDAAVRRYAPADPFEEALVEQVAATLWRLRRVPTIESQIFAHTLQTMVDSPFDAQPDALDRPDGFWGLALVGEERSHDTIARYQRSLRRALSESFKNLAQFRRDAGRPDAPSSPQDDPPPVRPAPPGVPRHGDPETQRPVPLTAPSRSLTDSELRAAAGGENKTNGRDPGRPATGSCPLP